MATVQEISLKYSAKGVKSVVRGDRKVRDSIQETADVARQESGTISRWMERHKSALRGIAGATAGALGAILAASPRARAELSSVRTAFSILADTIVRDVLPESDSASDGAFDLAQAYRDLPDPVRKAASTLGVAAGVAATVGLVFGPMGALIAGVGTAALIAAGHFGVLGTVMNVVQWTGNLLASLAKGNWKEAWDTLTDGVREYAAASLEAFVTASTALLGALARVAVQGVLLTGQFVGGVLSTLNNAVGPIAVSGEDMVGALTDAIKNGKKTVKKGVEKITDQILGALPSVSDLRGIGSDMMGGLADGIRSGVDSVGDAAGDAAGAIRDKLPGSDAKEGPLDDFTSVPDTMTSEMARIGDETGAVSRGARDLAAAARPPSGGGGGGGGGTSVEINIERGAIQMSIGAGTGRDSIDERELADEIFEEANRRSGGQTGPL